MSTKQESKSKVFKISQIVINCNVVGTIDGEYVSIPENIDINFNDKRAMNRILSTKPHAAEICRLITQQAKGILEQSDEASDSLIKSIGDIIGS